MTMKSVKSFCYCVAFCAGCHADSTIDISKLGINPLETDSAASLSASLEIIQGRRDSVTLKFNADTPVLTGVLAMEQAAAKGFGGLSLQLDTDSPARVAFPQDDNYKETPWFRESGSLRRDELIKRLIDHSRDVAWEKSIAFIRISESKFYLTSKPVALNVISPALVQFCAKRESNLAVFVIASSDSKTKLADIWPILKELHKRNLKNFAFVRLTDRESSLVTNGGNEVRR